MRDEKPRNPPLCGLLRLGRRRPPPCRQERATDPKIGQCGESAGSAVRRSVFTYPDMSTFEAHFLALLPVIVADKFYFETF